MGDVVFLAIALAFFAICVLYVKWCDRIIGVDDHEHDDTQPDRSAVPAADEVAA